jgi:hypothetical protein
MGRISRLKLRGAAEMEAVMPIRMASRKRIFHMMVYVEVFAS